MPSPDAGGGAEVPGKKAVDADAPKFIVEIKGSGGFETVDVGGEIPIEIRNARLQTGTATVVLAETNAAETHAGHKGTYIVTYTALGPMDDGAVQVTIPRTTDGLNLDAQQTTWNFPYDPEDDDLKGNLEVELTGSRAELSATTPIVYDSDDRTIIVKLEALDGGDTVKFMLKNTTAQPRKADKVYFSVYASPDLQANLPETTRLLEDDEDEKKQQNKPIKVLQARNGSGSIVAFDGSDPTSIIKVVTISETLSGGIKFKFTPVGHMLKGTQIELEIPDPWTAPVKEAGEPGGIAIEDDANDLGVQNIPSLSNSDAIPKLKLIDPANRKVTVEITTETFTSNDSFFIVYNNPTAPDRAGFLTFDANSGGEPLSSPPKIFASQEGNGSGSMEIDKETVSAAEYIDALKFTYTAADTIRGGELKVKIPTTWGKAKENISSPTSTRSGFTPVPEFDDGDHTVVIPIRALDVREEISFEYKGRAQNTAEDMVSFVTETKVTNAGNPGAISAPPSLKVTNVKSGEGSVTVDTGNRNKSSVAAASRDNEIIFDFKAVGTMDGGTVSMTVPPNWSLPVTDRGDEGFVDVETPEGGEHGLVSIDPTNERTVNVQIRTLGPDEIVRIIYGSGAFSASVVAQSERGRARFTFKTKGSSGADFKGISPVTIIVTNADAGTGEMSVERTGAPEGLEDTVTAGSAAEFVFTYTPEGTMDGGAIQLTVPEGWAPPREDSGEGYTTYEEVDGAEVESISFDLSSDGRGMVTVKIFTLSVGQQIRIKYGSGGGNNGVIVPAEPGFVLFNVSSQGSADDEEPLQIELDPEIEIMAPGDGFGTATVSGGPYRAGSSGNTVTVTFTANANVVEGSGVSVDVPMGWTVREEAIEVESAGDTGDWQFNEQTQTVTVDILALNKDETITFTYSDVTVQGNAANPGDEDAAVFIVQSRGAPESQGGVLTELGAASSEDDPDTESDESKSPHRRRWTVTVINAADGSGTLDVSPKLVAVGGANNNITFTYTAAGTMNGGSIRVIIPPEWPDRTSRYRTGRCRLCHGDQRRWQGGSPAD